jgi:hypothetical protein
MCAEVLWWRCHRRIIADVLVSLGVSVVHIRDEDTAEPHRLASPARIIRGRLTYALAPRPSGRALRARLPAPAVSEGDISVR